MPEAQGQKLSAEWQVSWIGRRFHLLGAGRSTVGCFNTASTSHILKLFTWLAIVACSKSDLKIPQADQSARSHFVGSSKYAAW